MPKISDAIVSTEKDRAELDDVLGVRFGLGGDGLPVVLDAEVRPPQAQAVTDDTLVCIRGPCRHYAEVLVGLDAANRDQTFRERRRYCTALAAQQELMELTDGNVYECSLHEPRNFVGRVTGRVAKQPAWLALAVLLAGVLGFAFARSLSWIVR